MEIEEIFYKNFNLKECLTMDFLSCYCNLMQEGSADIN